MKIMIKERLEEQERSLSWLKDHTGLGYPTIWSLANGKTTRVNFETLDLICTVLNCDIEDILKAEEMKPL